MTVSSSYEIRAKLDHPVIDADGHTSEYLPAFGEYLPRSGGHDGLQQALPRSARRDRRLVRAHPRATPHQASDEVTVVDAADARRS